MLDLFETHPYLPFQTSNRKKCLDEFYSYKVKQVLKHLKLVLTEIKQNITQNLF